MAKKPVFSFQRSHEKTGFFAGVKLMKKLVFLLEEGNYRGKEGDKGRRDVDGGVRFFLNCG